jgi:hypothetical protein
LLGSTNQRNNEEKGGLSFPVEDYIGVVSSGSYVYSSKCATEDRITEWVGVDRIWTASEEKEVMSACLEIHVNDLHKAEAQDYVAVGRPQNTTHLRVCFRSHITTISEIPGWVSSAVNSWTQGRSRIDACCQTNLLCATSQHSIVARWRKRT